MLFSGAGPLVYRDLDAAARALNERDDGMPLLRLAAEVVADEDASAPEDFSYGLFSAVSCMDYQQIYDMTSPLDARRQKRRRDEESAQPSRDFSIPFTSTNSCACRWTPASSICV